MGKINIKNDTTEPAYVIYPEENKIIYEKIDPDPYFVISKDENNVIIGKVEPQPNNPWCTVQKKPDGKYIVDMYNYKGNPPLYYYK